MITATMTVVTIYAGLYGDPLYCNRPATPYRYTPDTLRWAALDVSEYTSGRARCGDTVLVIVDGVIHSYLALDAGRFGDHCVVQPGGECYGIVADIPVELAPFRGLSAVGWLMNSSRRSRDRMKRGRKR